MLSQTKAIMTKFKLQTSTRQVFTTIVISMWAISFLANLINPKYNPPDYVNPLIMLVGGYLFATSNKENKK
jgi:Na+/pantothenate symporter